MAEHKNSVRTFLLAFAVAGLGYLNWHLAEAEIDVSPIVPPGDGAQAMSQDGAPGPVHAPALPPVAVLRETISRPLFHPTRRPFQPPRETEAAEAPPVLEPEEPAAVAPSGLSLVGVMGGGATSMRALLRAEGQSYGTWVEVGGEIAGWRLSSIEDGAVRIEKSGSEEELLLHRSPSK